MKKSLMMLCVAMLLVAGLALAGCKGGGSPSGSGKGGGSGQAGGSNAAAQTGVEEKTYAVVNPMCPIMGGKINSAEVPASLTRDFAGQRVGFCCADCPPEWDKLSDPEKTEKLAKAMGQGAEGAMKGMSSMPEKGMPGMGGSK